jgi:hypothetical protein
MKEKNTKEKALKMYRVTLAREGYSQTYIAKTASSARYQFWRDLDTGWPYKDYLNVFKVKCLGTVDPTHKFGNKERFERMCKHRSIEFAYMGMTVDVDGEKGTIVGSNSSMNLDVLFPERTGVENCHPTWQTTYYNDSGEIVKCYKKQAS